MSNDPFGICLQPKCDDEPKELPPIKDQIIGFINTAWDIVYGFFTGKGLRVTRKVYHERLNICNGCEYFIQDTQRCAECGCFMKTKAKFKQAYCPVNNWGIVE